ncbi:[FeFe] hydrogenase H-cluster radical SAM maturase HydE [Caloramator sp. ALD01]|uniref:[FeFe] hydrogenase H-cluster radical SAM maturase HydE n=1 Tax=Caloramator sp. ALD01 TaxID=1031288 RepID=UPI0003F6BEC6|nr:[FeFe] hydrogenase H-cluster radical SAM maturase HydE [Caloramator sp. ALD01]
MKELIYKIVEGYEPTLDEMEKILSLNEEDAEVLFKAADEVKKRYFGNEVHIRGIIEFSSYCRADCYYCGLRCSNRSLPRYRMDKDEIIECAKEAVDAGYRSLVLQSGEDLYYTKEILGEIVERIKEYSDVAITLSIGERSFEEYEYLKEKGADRFLMKHETADESLYNSLHPHSSFKNRIGCLKNLKTLGYQVGSGFMIGLPGQTLRTVAKDIMLLKELDVDMAGIGPFIPHKDTPLGKYDAGSAFLTVKAVALTRILLKRPHLPATTALGVLNTKYKDKVFFAGANVIMQKVEPHKYRRLYEIYPKDIKFEKSIREERMDLENYLLSLGLKISDSRGDALKI